jgi:two-component system response regulator AtoC
MTTSDTPLDNTRRVLLAEDDEAMRQLFGRILRDEGLEVIDVADGLSAIARLADAFDLLVTDLKMPGADGLEVLRNARLRQPQLPVVLITAFGSISGAVEAMRLGAFDYLQKPLPSPQTLRDVARRALAADHGAATSSPVVAEDPKTLQLLETVGRVAPRDTTVLLLGESGVGKEVIARHVHELSDRREGPFVAVNCAALTETLLESELFGHEKGAFSGAVSQHQGRFEQADGGTLFLDEVGETSPSLQTKLLRVLQERRFERVGGESPLEVDVRVVAATNRDLQTAVADGAFREDLYYRLAVFPITIPPLRERSGDILPLVEHFLALLSRGPDRTPATLDEGARSALEAYGWPGNVRELANVVERATVLAGSDAITAEILALEPTAAASATSAGGTLKDMERRAIEAALQAEDGNRRRAAKRLGIALRTLQYKIKTYGLS